MGERLIKPFVGAGNVFINTNYKQYFSADELKIFIEKLSGYNVRLKCLDFEETISLLNNLK